MPDTPCRRSPLRLLVQTCLAALNTILHLRTPPSAPMLSMAQITNTCIFRIHSVSTPGFVLRSYVEILKLADKLEKRI
jgi:hypothetical protein